MTQQEGKIMPSGWSESLLENIASDVSYGYTASSSNERIGPHLLRITDIQDNKVDWNSVPYCQIDKVKLPQYKVKKNDLLFARTGATVGKSYLVKENVPNSVYASYLIRVRCLDGADIKYMAHFFNSPNYWNQITEFSSGIGQPNVNGTKLKALSIPLAPLPEQKRIVEKLDSLLAQVDTIQQRLNHLPDIINRFRQSVLAAAVSGKLTEQWRGENYDRLLSLADYEKITLDFFQSKKKAEQSRIEKIKAKEWFYSSKGFIPDGWVDSHLIDITSVITCGVAKKPNYIDEGVKFLSAQNAKPFAPNLNKIKYISQDDFSTFTVGAKPEKNDILYSRVGANFGEACVIPWDFDFAIYVSLTLIKPNRNLVDEQYLTMFLNSKDGVLQSRGGIMGSGIQNLNVENVRKYKIPLPSLKEQTEIVRLVEQYFALADTLEKHLDNAKQRVDNLTQSILAKAFKGELVQQDPSDEPADKLLERIKVARLEAEKLEKAAKASAKKAAKARKTQQQKAVKA